MADASPSSSHKMQATVADEPEELKAEQDGVVAEVDGDVDMKPVVKSDGEDGIPDGSTEPVEAEPEDPNKLPSDACETLYIQNLNEKVRIPGAGLQILRSELS